MLTKGDIEQLSYTSGVAWCQLTKVCEILPAFNVNALNKVIAYSRKANIHIVIVAMSIQAHGSRLI